MNSDEDFEATKRILRSLCFGSFSFLAFFLSLGTLDYFEGAILFLIFLFGTLYFSIKRA